MDVYQENAFEARVAFMARTISSGGTTSRRFNGCCEMNDGDAVVVALYRRTQKRPNTMLAKNLWRYLCQVKTMGCVDEHGSVSDADLPALAAAMRKASREAEPRALDERRERKAITENSAA